MKPVDPDREATMWHDADGSWSPEAITLFWVAVMILTMVVSGMIRYGVMA